MTIGLTGGIGSGKTTVAKLFETMGCVIYNSDDKAKDVYFNAGVKAKVIALLGENAYLNATTLDKKYISEKVFSDNELLQRLNAIIHPAVKNDFEAFTHHYSNQLVIKESAILFETGIYKGLDATILITAPLNEKIERVMKRNGVSKAEVEKRMQSQWTDEEKIPLANYIISNASSEALIPQAIHILKQINNNA
ncbi:MAG: dephospho-CoA kinase [Bacteroidota bacterium]